MDINVDCAALTGELASISSKSYAHRIILAAALAKNPSKIVCKNISVDIMTTIEAANALGANIDLKGDTLTVTPIKRQERAICVNCNESGSTLRFLLPIISALGLTASVDGKGRLPERPLGEILDVLRSHGACIAGDRLPLTLSGALKSGEYRIDAGVSSQYITGLLLALPFLEGGSEITLVGELKSKGYIDITLETLEAFGIRIERKKGGFIVEGGQQYTAPPITVVEGDWSNAAFPLVGGLLTGGVTVKGLNPRSCQGDKEIVNALKKMGGDIQAIPDAKNANSVDFRAVLSNLSAIDIDVSDIPDAAPILAAACAAARGKSTLYGVERLRAKECDRLEAIIVTLGALGIRTEYAPNTLAIYGDRDTLADGSTRVTLSSFNDHRMAMTAAILGSLRGNVTVTGAESVSKSYPSFWDDLEQLKNNP